MTSSKGTSRGLKASDLLPDPAKKKGAQTLCLCCFEKWDSNMSRRVQQCKMRDSKTTMTDKRGTDDRNEFNVAVSKMRGSLFLVNKNNDKSHIHLA